jgi:uncharacterized delta-60 repeat protein
MLHTLRRRGDRLTASSQTSCRRGSGRRFRPCLEGLEGRAVPDAGALDPAFGTAGLATADFGGTADLVRTVLVQPDGKIVLAGTAAAGGFSGFALARFGPDGRPDPGFGAGGRVRMTLGTAAGAALQPDGKIVVAGTTNATGPASRHFVVARYHPDGSLDASFGFGGVVTTDLGGFLGDVVAAGVALQADGKIVVVGNRPNLPPAGFSDLALVRYLPDGRLDATFGSGGRVVTTGGPATAGVLVQPDGRLVVGGTGEPTFSFPLDTGFYVRRFHPDGSADLVLNHLDLGRGANGAADLALQPDGKLVAVGRSAGRPVLVRLNADGTLDAGFGVRGQVLTGFGTAAAVQTDGKIVTAGGSTAGTGVGRYTPDGGLETRFGVAGTAAAPFAPADVALQADGRILAAGALGGAGGDTDFALARYSGGAADPLPGTAHERFVRQVYLDVLGRPADPGGLASWAGQLDRGQATRAQVVFAIENSPEYHGRMVRDLYQALFNRPVDPSGQATWTGFLARGGTAEQLTAALLGSDEYLARNGGDARGGFVDALYRDVLRRYADEAGRQNWIAFLDSGASRSEVAAAFLRSLEADQGEVTGLYHRFLHRAPDAGGLAAYTGALQRGAAGELVLAAVSGSDEYFAQA